jgi:hypothetical protein
MFGRESRHNIYIIYSNTLKGINTKPEILAHHEKEHYSEWFIFWK